MEPADRLTLYRITFNKQDMKLTVKDRFILLNTAIPTNGTRSELKNLIIPITDKLKISAKESAAFKSSAANQDGFINVSYTDEAFAVKDIPLSKDELDYLKSKIDAIDKNGMFSIDTFDTYEKILAEAEK